MNTARILLVDDHTLVRAGIRGLIDQAGAFTVCAEASDGAGALAALELHRPDILVTDIGLGAESGLDLVRAVHQRWPALPIVVVSMHAAEATVSTAIRDGASAYVLKDAAPSELACALDAVRRGDSYLSPVLSGRMMRWSIRGAGACRIALTDRQRQILGRIGAGKSTKQIAFELGLSEKTVAGHRAQLMERLGIRDRVGLALFALEQGMVDQS